MQYLLPHFPKLGVLVALLAGVAVIIGLWKIIGEKTADEGNKTKPITKTMNLGIVFFVAVALLVFLVGGYYLMTRRITPTQPPQITTVPTLPPQQTLSRTTEIKITPSADKTEATITWPAGFGTGVLGYNIYLGLNNNARPRNHGVFVTENSYIFKNLTPGQSYFVFIESVALSPSSSEVIYSSVESDIFTPL